MRIQVRELLSCFAIFALAACQSIGSIPRSSAKIDADIVDAVLFALVEEGSVAGVSALIYSGDQEIYYGNFGQAVQREDEKPGQDWRRDTLVAIYSMTKPVTGVTLMSLYEEGLFDLDAPLSKYLPEYADVQVLAGIDSKGDPVLVAPHRPIQVIDIFRQTACFGYGWEGTPAARLMNEANVLDPSKPLSQFSQELAKVPLFCHPGTQWKYGVSVDVQARLAEVITGRPYEELVQERVLGPLGLSDTGYFVPADQKPRLAAIYIREEDGTLRRDRGEDVYSFWTKKPVQINGGHGLVSSIDDYMRFALMLQNRGSLDGVQILRPETVAFMTRDHLPDGLTSRDFLPGKGQVGFGLDFAVRVAPPVDDAEPFGVDGEFFWDGAASTLFWVDPKNDFTVVFFVQIKPYNGDIQARFRRAVYDALGLTAEIEK
jgi:CubicO group peptidase (beta-lactamase class C family)